MNNIKRFWENCHKNKKIGSLSGVEYKTTVDVFKLNPLIEPGIRVLEVGVGLGYVVRGFHDAGAVVSCVDISEGALERVAPYCEDVFTIEDLGKLPSDYFDIIVCGNVVQHIATELLIIELEHIVRSLKKGGVFAVEFVSNNKTEDTGINPSDDVIKRGGCCRTPEYLEKLINNAGGQCKLIYDHEVKGNPTVQGCHIFHVTK